MMHFISIIFCTYTKAGGFMGIIGKMIRILNKKNKETHLINQQGKYQDMRSSITQSELNKQIYDESMEKMAIQKGMQDHQGRQQRINDELWLSDDGG